MKTRAYFKIRPTIPAFIRTRRNQMLQLQPGGKASSADCVTLGTNLVWDFWYVLLSKDLAINLVSGRQENPGRKTQAPQEVALWFRRWHSPPWVTRALPGCSPAGESQHWGSESCLLRARKYWMTLVTRIATSILAFGYITNWVMTLKFWLL